MRRSLLIFAGVMVVAAIAVTVVLLTASTHKGLGVSRQLARIEASYDGGPVPVIAGAGEGSALPSITGNSTVPVVGVPIHSQPGHYIGPHPTGFSYQWYRCATVCSSTRQAIEGATSSTYTPTGADIGHALIERVQAHGVNATTTQMSVPTGVISAPGKRYQGRVRSGSFVTFNVRTTVQSLGSIPPGASKTIAHVGDIRVDLVRGPSPELTLNVHGHQVWMNGPIDPGTNKVTLHVGWGDHGYVEVWLNGYPATGFTSPGSEGPGTREYLNTGRPQRVKANRLAPTLGTTLASVAPVAGRS
jgi:hypothetical protein